MAETASYLIMSTVIVDALVSNGEDILRLIIATGLGALIGYERE